MQFSYFYKNHAAFFPKKEAIVCLNRIKATVLSTLLH